MMLNRWVGDDGVIHAHTGHAAALAVLSRRPYVAHRRVDFASSTFKYRQAARVVAVSRAISEVMQKDGYDGATVVPDGIPVTDQERSWARLTGRLFQPPSPEERQASRMRLAEEFNIDRSGPWIGNLAALVPHKDHQNLVAAALIVLLKRPDARVLIAGKGPEEAELLRQIRQMGLINKVVLLGHQDPHLMMMALDVFCLSSWGEGMGSVLLEAMAYGVPVAATSAGGIPEVVDDGETGLLAPPRNAEALAAALRRLLDDRELAQRLRKEALRRLPKFGLTRMAQEMEKVYASVR